MSVIVPIENASSYIFDRSEELPNIFYIHIMDLLKTYYEFGDNLNEIQEYLDENENTVNPLILKKIRDILIVKKKKECFNWTILYNCCDVINRNFYKFVIIILTFTSVGAVIGGFGYMITTGHTSSHNFNNSTR